ncbi:MAG: hypothetical protein R2795_21970 [Saprospiraceae bacterium]
MNRMLFIGLITLLISCQSNTQDSYTDTTLAQATAPAKETATGKLQLSGRKQHLI